jgi:uncharacterized protein (DUF2336 family)
MELSKEDVTRLMTEPSPSVRAVVAEKIGNTLDRTWLTETEMKLAHDIIRHMAADISVQVRAALAESVKKAKKLPHDVAVKLAKDVEEVALPVLEFSELFTDEDLVEIVKSQSPEKQEAIARRETVSEKVASAIVEEGAVGAVTSLIKNKKAQINDASLMRVTERFANNQNINNSLAVRDKLPLSVAERLVGKVSDALKEYLVKQTSLPKTVVSDIVEQSREQSTASLLGIGKNEEDIEKLAHQLKETNRLTPSLIVRALCVGDILFFEASMSALANVPIHNARVLLHDAGKLGLKSIYDKTALPQGMFPIIRVALEVVKELKLDGFAHDHARYRARVIERILTQYQDFNSDDLTYLLDKLSDLVDMAA